MFVFDVIFVSFIFSLLVGVIIFFIEGEISDALWAVLASTVLLSVITFVCMGVDYYLTMRGY
jgi:hypothetical protein